MGRSESLLSRGEEKTWRKGGKEKEGWTFPCFFSSSKGLLNWFPRLRFEFVFQIGSLAYGSASQCFSGNFPKFGPLWNVCIGSSWPPPPFCCFLSFFSSRSPSEKKKEATFTQKSMYFQTGCLCWQHRSLAAIKKFALPDRLFLFWTLHAVQWITGAS